MASIRIKFRASQKENEEGTLYYQIIHDRVVRQVKTNFKIRRSEWNEDDGSIILQQNQDRNNYLISVRHRLKCGQEKFEELLREQLVNKHPEDMPIDDLVAAFETRLNGVTLFDYMKKLIGIFKQNGQIRTAETYQTTLNSFGRFRGECDIPLSDLTAEMMESYQYYLKHHDVGINTIAFYMKRIRAAYNRAVEQDLVPPANLFKHVYTGMEKTAKRAISAGQLKAVKNLELKENSARCYSRDLFLLSFYLRGMSFIDMAYLQKTDLKNGILTYRRKKTGQRLTIQWEECMQKLVDKYPQEESLFLLPILQSNKGELRKQYQRKLANINRNLKAIGKFIGLKAPLTMYVARHSWVSIARDMNIPLSVISEGLGHDNEVTTSIYLSTVGTEAIDNANKRIIDLV